MHSFFFKITPLGGIGITGALNCAVYETKEEAILVDCGSRFPDEQAPGVDIVIPGFSYLHKIRKKLKALVLTHGHEDHIGGTPYLLSQFKIPVYATPFTEHLVRRKLEEFPEIRKPVIHSYKPGDSLKIGSFEIESFFINHSIPDAAGLAISTPRGFLVHLTDWKIDKNCLFGKSTDTALFSSFGKKGVLALLSDSTNAISPGYTLSEKQVYKNLYKTIKHAQGRVVVTLFASHIERIAGLARIAKKTGRTLCFAGRRMQENIGIAREMGLVTTENVIDVEEAKHLDPKKVLLVTTGCQAEPNAALSKMSQNNFKPFTIQEGDLILFSARVIPGNEKDIFVMLSDLTKRGATVLHRSGLGLHTSGHAQAEELKIGIRKLRPQYFIPIHGDYRSLAAHAKLAEECGVKKNIVLDKAQAIVFSDHTATNEPTSEQMRAMRGRPHPALPVEGATRAQIIENSECSVSHVQGQKYIVPEHVIRERKKLSETGIVVCFVTLDKEKNIIIGTPELASVGVLCTDRYTDIFEEAKNDLTHNLSEIPVEIKDLKEKIKTTLRRFFRKKMVQKPVVVSVIHYIGANLEVAPITN